MLFDLVSSRFPWGGRNKLIFSPSCLMEYFPSLKLLFSKLVLPYPIPSPPSGASRIKCPPREMIYGQEECKSHQFTIFKIFSWVYLNLRYERQFRSTLYNVGQLGVYGNWRNGQALHCSVPCRLIRCWEHKMHLSLNVLQGPKHCGTQWTINPILSDDDTRRFLPQRKFLLFWGKKSLPILGDWARENYIMYPSDIRLE